MTTASSNQAAIQEWVDALRSGSYTQGKTALTAVVDGERRYCCLGVACDVFADRLKLTLVDPSDDSQIAAWRSPQGDSSHAHLPLEVSELLGLGSSNPVINFYPYVTATRANDDLGWTFDQIANAIEKTYLTRIAGEASVT